ncbi:phosphatidylserine decarboxylase [Methylovulum psychrotolerans]|uniref:Phosphatidylserine decarboxylase n=1 Tax=Methylovulum psychrotolerans TaxID=1704499 RepID=A0A2S5CH83_9GAMM|nr:phosphatidylserine decarboxylase [Methylovulum psychrotolerans]POZ50165.1 phosphatidylserine decarboxylase [Methylovulum psychrotolerans]
MQPIHPVVKELAELIATHQWADQFNEAINNAHKQNVRQIRDIKNLEDYLAWMNELLYWVPSENYPGKEIYNRLYEFYFILDQPPVLGLQNKVLPHDIAPPLTDLSAWMVNYAKAMGEFLDTPDSLTPESLASFYKSPNYNMGDYLRPHGDWKTFNQFFARNYKPGYRPVAALCDQHVIVSPADATFAGQWEIRTDSQVTVKNLHWRIEELLEGSAYKDRFTNGMFMHSFLNTSDYHRQHAPVGGKVVEARVIPGQVYLEVQAVPIQDDPEGCSSLVGKRAFDAPDNAGYQFAQARGLVVLDTPIGLVAVLPIGMAQVSSVIITAEVGVTLRKGEELSYFQFGGSDIIVLFESASNVSFTAQPNVHYKQGAKIAQAYPVL